MIYFKKCKGDEYLNKSLTYNIQTYNSVKEVLFFNDNQSKNFGFSYINKGK